MAGFTLADTLHRLVKEAIDSGAATSLPEAEAMFHGFRLHLAIGDAEVQDQHHQSALLTGIALAQRVFLGGVSVSGSLTAPLKVPFPLGATLGDAVATLGAIIGDQPTNTPLITIGGEAQPYLSGFHIRTVCSGWRGGIVPATTETLLDDNPVMPLAPMLAAALAVNEAFLSVRTGNSAYGRRLVGISLWSLPSKINWLTIADEPVLCYLPTRLWLIGLGHLGQAYLWGLGLLPYTNPAELSLVLQDVDIITPSSLSTSILTNNTMIGHKKTRMMARWAEQRGFKSVILERLFGGDFVRQSDEPSIALCGLDNALGRRALDKVGFDFVVEAGLGRGYRDFRTMRLHTLPTTRTAADIWKLPDVGEDFGRHPGYEKMLNDGELDRCGVTLLAGKAVGAPFVGAVAACLALSEVLRLLHNGATYQFIDLDLQNIDHRSAVSHTHDFSRLNPGYVLAANG